MSITDYIVQKTGLETSFEEGNLKFKKFNTGSVEVEVGEFLYGLVRLVKPEKVCETGTYKGISAAYIALALKENGFGELDTIEADSQWWQEATELWKKLEVDKLINLYKMRVEDFNPEPEFKGSDFSDSDYMQRQREKYGLVFLDTEPDVRFNELKRFFPYTKLGGFIAIHDLHPHLGLSGTELHGMTNWPFGDFRQYFGDKILDHELTVVNFSTPRGFTLFQKASNSFVSYQLLTGKLK